MEAALVGIVVAQPSVTAPFDQAMRRTGRVLFKPFDLTKWLVLGFCAFLAYLGQGGGGGNFATNWGGGGGGGGGPTGQPGGNPFLNWLNANVGLVIAVGVLVVLVVVVAILLLTWIKCRARFMFIDGIVRNRGAVVEPWKEFREQGNSFFLFSVALALVQLAIWLPLAGICLLIAWPDIQQHQFDNGAWTALILLVGVGLPVGFFFALFAFIVRHYMVTLMYTHRLRAVPALRLGWEQLIKPYSGSFVTFLLMRIVIVLGIGVAATLATCLTCCIAALPYVGTVILLPLYVFEQSYTLYYIQSFGPSWHVFTHDESAARCPRCGYDVRIAPSGVCPECGYNLSDQPNVPSA